MIGFGLVGLRQFFLSSKKLAAYIVPGGHAKGWMQLPKENNVLAPSTMDVEATLSTDLRFQSRHWNPWMEYSST
jgi:hypothetical protein